MPTDFGTVHLHTEAVSLLLAPDHAGRPTVLHWGAKLNDSDIPSLIATSKPAILNSSTDIPRSFPLVTTRFNGWAGTPTVEWMLGTGERSELLPQTAEATNNMATFQYADSAKNVELTLVIHLTKAGVVRLSANLANSGSTEVELGAINLGLPLPRRAEEILDFTGRWTSERSPQRRDVGDGTWLRESRRGRPGHDSAFVSIVGEKNFGFRHGEVWAAHVAWSGNQQQYVQRLPEGAGVHTSVVGGGELLDLGEVRLQPGEKYETPYVWFAWSDSGIDGVTEQFHREVRQLPLHPKTPRPVVLNTWEAVYFDHDFDRLKDLARTAARVGVERFVLDDGWFTGRRDDHRALGDWTIDKDVWPNGLAPLAHTVHDLNMEFGLWFEPEMVSPNSELARMHPEWILGEITDPTSRNQLVLDLANPEVFDRIFKQMHEVISSCGVDFVKWDHNRDIHAGISSTTHGPGVHAQTKAAYRLAEKLQEHNLGLEIESCASGGARPDLGILSRTQRMWPSDTNDPLSRQIIQRWTATVLPPEIVGTHVGPEEAHTTHRVTNLPFRLATALFGHAGLEWDISQCSQEELDAIAKWTKLYRRLRPLLHSGRTVRADDVDEGGLLHGVVADDATHAVFAWVRLDTSPALHTPRVPLPGLDRHRMYSIEIRTELGEPSRHQIHDPQWMVEGQIRLSGNVISSHGIPLPLLNPGNALLLEVTAID